MSHITVKILISQELIIKEIIHSFKMANIELLSLGQFINLTEIETKLTGKRFYKGNERTIALTANQVESLQNLVQEMHLLFYELPGYHYAVFLEFYRNATNAYTEFLNKFMAQFEDRKDVDFITGARHGR